MNQARLVDCCEFILDGTHGSPIRTESGVPVLSAQNVVDGKLSFETDRFTSLYEYEAFRRRLDVHPFDVLLTIVGTIGRVAIVTEQKPLVFQRSVAVLRPKQEVLLPVFLFHALQQDSVKAQLARSTNQSSQAGIYLGKLKEVEIPLPPLDEQGRIAALLDKANALREKRQQSITKLDSLARSMFLDMFGDPLTNSKRWPMTVLGNHLSFVTSGSRGWAKYYSPTGARFIRSLDVRMNYISDRDAVYVVPPIGKEADRARVKPGDVLLTITGSQIGRVAPVPKGIGEAYVSQHVAILRLENSFHPVFVSMFMSEDRGGQHQIHKMQYGQTKPGLNLEQIRNFKIPQIPLTLQKEFVARSDKIRELANKQHSYLRQLESLFKTLQLRAFSGELFTERAEPSKHLNELSQYV